MTLQGGRRARKGYGPRAVRAKVRAKVMRRASMVSMFQVMLDTEYYTMLYK